MRTLLAAAILPLASLLPAPLLASGALAQERPSSLALPCARVRELVVQRGAMLLGTGGATFDRYVADRRYCQASERVEQSFAPTLDDPQCPVGYRCKEQSSDKQDL